MGRTTVLVRDPGNPRGYKTVHRLPWAPPSTETWVPWALTAQAPLRVIYETLGRHRNPAVKGVKKYDATVSRQRRTEAETALGMMILKNPQAALPAVRRVSSILIQHLRDLNDSDPKKTRTFMKMVAENYLWNDRMGFGRLGSAKELPKSGNLIYWKILQMLEQGPLPVMMNIQDQIGRKGAALFGEELGAAYKRVNKKLRPTHLFHDTNRGRANVARPKATTSAGIMPTGKGAKFGKTAQARVRGVDTVVRNEDTENAYYYDLDERALTFGAGPSGTTGTLLTTALVFGKLSGESLRQYLLGIVGYLVGGGMHSLHESFTVAGLAGLDYRQGGFTNMLPKSFLLSQDYKKWHADYYDIAERGALHWMYNDTNVSRVFRVPKSLAPVKKK